MFKEQIAVLLNSLKRITSDLETDRYCFESAKIVIEATKLHWEIIKYIEQQETAVPDRTPLTNPRNFGNICFENICAEEKKRN